jgi:ketosteroid isomerase-like protein
MTMSVEENKALVRRFYEEIDKGNSSVIDELVAEDYLDHSPPPFPELSPGRQGVKQAFELFWEATPGFHRIDDRIAEGDKVVTRLTAFGVHEANLAGISRTGKKLERRRMASCFPRNEVGPPPKPTLSRFSGLPATR